MLVLPLVAAAAPHFIGVVWALLAGGAGWPEALQFSWGLLYIATALLAHRFLEPAGPLDVRGALVLVALSWILVPLLSAVPVAAVLHVPFIDAWFESVSGYTTTGLSVFTGGVDPVYGVYVPAVEELPPGVLYWRAAAQWLGGFGVVVVFYAFARLAGLPAHLAGLAEGRFERLEPSIARSLRALMGLYLLLTLVSAFTLYAAGMSLSDAFYHAMTALSTGGFSSHSSSIGFYHSPVVEAAAVFSMLMGASNFADLYAVLHGRRRRLSIEWKTMLAVLVPGAAAALLVHHSWLGRGWLSSLRVGLFDASSALSTTGFGVEDFSSKPDLYKFLIAILMFIGGSAFSTAGGIKLYRLAVLASTVKWTWNRAARGPDYLQVHRAGPTPVDLDELAKVAEIVFLFAVLDILGALVLLASVPGLGLADAVFEATSALCTVGLSVGVTGAATPLPAKLAMIALMSLGRLEVHTYIAAAASAYAMARLRRHCHCPPGRHCGGRLRIGRSREGLG